MSNKQSSDGIWSGRDTELLERVLAGGLIAGGGLGLGTSLLNSLKSQAQPVLGEPAPDEDVIKIQVPGAPAHKQADAAVPEPDGPSMLGMSTVVPALALGGMSGYHAVRRLYDMFKSQELKDDLTIAQRNYRDKLQQEQQSQKSAGGGIYTGMSHEDMLEALALATISVPTVASYVATGNLMDKYFPKVKPAPRGEVTPMQLETAKAASAESDDDLWASVPMVTSIIMSREKAADISLVPDLVCAAAQGRMREIEEVVATDGWTDDSLGIFKGASARPTRGELKQAASIALASNPITGPGFSMLLAAEMHDMCPTLAKAAQHIPQAEQREFLKCAALHERLVFAHRVGEAGLTPEKVAQALQASAEHQKKDEHKHKLLDGASDSVESRDSGGREALQAPAKDPIDHAFTFSSDMTKLQMDKAPGVGRG